MAVFRVNKTADYTVMSNFHLMDKRMSLKAKGLLSLILSLPDDWSYSISGLVAMCSEKEIAVKTALTELKKHGYLRIDKVKPTKENGGKYEYIYNIFEEPNCNQAVQNQGVENLPLENQALENQALENIPLYKDTNIQNTNIQNTNIQSTNIQSTDYMSDKPTPKQKKTKQFIPPIVEEIRAYCEQRNNNVDPQKFFDYYDAAEWIDSKGEKVKSWKQKVITWENSNKKREQPKQTEQKSSGNIFLDLIKRGEV